MLHTLNWMFEILQEAGPYSTPLCAAMALAMRWLLKDRDRMLAVIKEADADRFALLRQRAEDVEKARDEFREFSESSREVMREWTTKAEMLLTVRPGGPA